MLFDRFHKVVLLSAPADPVLASVAGKDPFGSTTEDRTQVASDLAASERVPGPAPTRNRGDAPIPGVVRRFEKLA